MNMVPSRRKIAVMGTGNIGLRHMEVLRAMGDVDVVAIPHRESRLAELEAQGYPTAADLRTAVSQGVHAAIVTSDTARHAEDVLSALEEGLHVLVEKPMALNAPEARHVEEEAVRLGRKVFVGCVLRFSDSLNRFQEWLPQVGALHDVQIWCQSYLPDWRPTRSYRDSYSSRVKEGGVVLDLIHEVDYAGWIFGWPTHVSGNFLNTGRLGIAEEEVAQMNWVGSRGFSLSIHLDYLTRPARRGIRACGEHGTIEWDGRQGRATLWLDGVSAQEFQSIQTRDEMFLVQARAWCAAVGGGTSSGLATAEDGIRALAVCDAARLSSQTRKEEKVLY